MKRIITGLFLIVGFCLQGQAQVLTNACEGIPCNSLPVCGVNSISNPNSYVANMAPYNTNPGGIGNCNNVIGGLANYTATPNWIFYRFKVSAGGTLNFAIIANDLGADMDWALWDITVSGCSSLTAGNLIECNSFIGAGGGAGTGMQPAPAAGFETGVGLTAGNTYILGISRKSGGLVTTGFTINFNGTTANLSDNIQPALGSIVPFDACNPVTQIKVKMTKAIRCSGIQTGDFNISGAPVFTAAAGIPCPGCTAPGAGINYSNVTDTVVLNFPTPLPPGTYTLSLTGGVAPQPFFDLCANLANVGPTLVFTITNPVNLTIGTSMNCATQQYRDTATATFGQVPYQYKIAGPGQANTYGLFTFGSNVFAGLTGGNTYTITVRDANNCLDSVVVSHPVYLALSFLTYKRNPPCNNQFNLDTLRVTQVNGGAGPFTFSLASTPAAGAAGAVLYAPGSWTNLAAGNYTITVTDAFGCTVTATNNIVNPAALVLPTPTSTNPTCFGDSTGTITASATGGTPPVNNYAISPSYPNTVISGPNNNVFSNLPGPGTYTILVTDANGCTASNTRTLTTPTQIVIYTGNVPASKINPTCINPCGGSIIANATGGTGGKKFYKYPLITPPNTYADSVLVAGGSFQNLCAGTYTIMAKDIQGCTSTATFVLTLPPLPDLTVTNIVPPLCNGGVGSIVTGVTGGTGPYTNASYTFAPPTPGMTATASGPGGIVGTYNGVPAGTYTLTVTDVNSCKDSVLSVIMTQPGLLVWNNTTPTNILCNGNNTGAVAVNVTGGTGAITYTITPLGPQTNLVGNFMNLTAQCYTITATDANLCTITSTVCLTQPPAFTVAISNITNVTCNPLCNGTAQATAAGGTPAYSYAITAPGTINAASGAITALCAGNYTVTVTDANLCTAITTFTVTQPPAFTVAISNITNVTCNPLCNGTAQATAGGGTPAYSYAITAPGVINVGTGAITALCAGSYTVTVTDANLCIATTTFTIAQPPVFTVAISNITNVTCNGLCNGTAQATAAGGTPVYTYAISAPGVINAGTGAITSLCAGNYTVTATDANLCTATTTFTISQPPVFTAAISNITNVTCNPLCNGTAQATGTGGTPAYTYVITAPGVINAATGAITALCAGNYTVTATDANLCTATTICTVTQPPVLSVTIAGISNVTCNPLCNGTAQATAVGGTPAYTFAINAPGIINAATGAITALCAGNYTVTITDANLCTATTNFTITQPPVFTVAVSNITNVTCNALCDGTAQATAVGGTPAYSYAINAPGLINAGTGAISSLCAGSYTVTATDANLCTATTTFTVTEPPVLTVAISNITNVTCNGLCDGTAQATAAGGTPAYSYAISAPGVINAATGAITGLCAGSYTVTVSDANLCTGTSSFTVTEPVILTVGVGNIINATCFGQCDGTAQATATGGTLNYTYSITLPGVINGATGAITALCAGVYTVTVTDANLCTASTTFTVTEPAQVVTTIANSTNPTCTPGCDGTVTVTGGGGNGPILFTITPAAGIIQAPLGTFSGLCAGTNYVITGTDANGCTGTTNISLSTPNAPIVTVSGITNVSCNGLCDGSAQAVAVGGTPPYVYSITAPGTIDINTGAITTLCAGSYTVTVTDVNNCAGTTNFVVTEPNLLTVTINQTTPVSCVPGCDGTATTITAGGTPGYTYAISGGASIDALGNASTLCAGIVYTITVADANACTGTTTIQLTAPNAPTVAISNITNVTCNGLCDGTAQSTAAGGTPAYSYAINAPGIINAATGAITGLCAGSYTVTVTDANLCTGTSSFTVTEPVILTVGVGNIINATCFGQCDGTAQATAAGGTLNYTYSITLPGVINGATGAITALCAGVYTVTVTDANLCTSSTTFTVTEPAQVVTTITNSTNPTCTPGCDGTVTVTGGGGNGPILFTITPAAGIIQAPLGTFSGLCAGTNYVITGTDANGCTGTTNISLSTPNAPVVTVSGITNVSCNGLCDGSAQAGASGGTPPYAYSITAPGIIDINTGAITNLCAGNYTVTVTDANSCVGTTNFVVTEPNLLTVTINQTTPVSCIPGCDGTATTITAGGTAGYTYAISGGAAIDALGSASNLCAGIVYTITVTDANACTGTTTIQLTAPNSPAVTINTSTSPSCIPGCDGTATTTTIGGIPVYVYSISGGAAINAAGTASNLCAGIVYTITVTDANACTGTTTIQLTTPNSPTITINTSTSPSCVPGCDGTASTISAGGTPGYTYAISGGASIDALGNAGILCAGTIYTITVTDANGCTGTTTIQLTTPNSPTITINTSTSPSCVPGCDGTASTISAGGTPGYTYAISGGASIDALGNASILCAGIIYTITVTDANGCTGTTTIQLTTPNSPTITINTSTSPSCVPGCDGTASTISAGGTPGYTYAISGGASIDALGNASILCAGIIYTITVTDANGCTGTTTIQLTTPNSPTITINTSTSPSCVPGCDGTASTISAGGTPGYTYAISGGASIDAFGNASNLCAATIYTITVTDANGCTATTTIQLTAPAAPTLAINTSAAPSCAPGCDGTATTTTIGGTPVYAYSITGGASIDVLGNASNLCAGIIYTITVTDANACTGTTTIQLTAPNSPALTINTSTAPTCAPGCDGTATTTTIGGTPVYAYSITGGASIDVLGNASNLCAVIIYTITVTDANGCTGTTTIQLTAPAGPVVTINTTTSPSCIPGCDGIVTMNIVAGITYSIAPAAGIIQAPLGTFSGLCAGTNYVITGTDANGCTGTTNISLSTPNAPVVTVSGITNVSCNGLCDGSAQAGASGGTPPYAYSITAPGIIDINTGAITNLCAGNYTVTVTDANSCVGTTNFVVTEPNLLTVTINQTTPVSCIPGCDGTATTITAGGTAGYTYAISGGAAIDALGSASNLCAGIVYTITVTDANACTGTTTIQLTAPNSPAVTINTSTSPSCIPGCDGTATTTTIGGIPVYVYSISGGAAINAAGTASNLCAGIVYTITVTDANACTGTTTIQLTTPNSPTITINTSTSPSCVPGCDGTASTISAGGTPGYTYAISGGASIDALGNAGILCAGTIYTITVTDANGCTGTTTIQLTTPNSPTITINTSTSPSCVPGCDGTASTISAGGTPGYTYAISGGASIDALGNAGILCAGTIYTITVTDANGCTGTTTLQLTAPNSPTITINTSTSPSCVPGCDGTASTISAGGTPGYTYAISGGASIDALGNASILCAGIIYTITVTDANGCTGTTTIQLTTPNSPTITINASTSPSCVPGCDGTATTISAGGTPGYTYAISGGASIDALGNAGILCAGIIYTITVTDANGCTGTTTIQLTTPNSPTITINTSTSPSCVPGCDGTASTISAGGTPGYTYAISGGASIDAFGNASNLCAATIYTITVTDANGCTATTTIQLTAPAAPTLAINTSTAPSCAPGCDGTATTTTIGGTPVYAYSITGGASIDVLGNASNLCAGIIYTITVTDANACTGTTTIQLTAPNSPALTINTSTAPTCAPGCDGTATTTTIGGTPVYAYSITGGASIDVLGNASNLCAVIIYTITVTDANGCTGTTTIQLTAPAGPVVTINTTTSPSCIPGCDGIVTMNIVAGITYSIAPAAGIIQAPLGTFSGLCAGTNYVITGTDANGCTGTTNISLSTPNAPVVTVSGITNVSCNGLCDGSAQAGASGGTPPYAYSITAPGIIDINTGAITNLCAGNYTVTVTDANSCVGTTNFVVTEPNLLTVTINQTTPVSCIPGCDGTATTITAGGTAGYTYAISGGAAIDALGSASNLCAGIVYTITVTDANACTGTTTIQLTAPNSPAVTINTSTSPSCIPGCDGTATTTTIGGIPVYVYSISGGAAINAAGTASNLCAGIVYTITVTDANACTGTTTIQLTTPNSPTITINTSTSPSCVPGCDGTASTISAGGTPGYTYAISGGASIDALGNAGILCAGTIYTITVTDANGCTGTTTIQLTTPNSPTITINTSTSPSCVPGCDGTASTISAGGTPGYTYAISGGASIDALGNASILCAGIIYTITVTDANGCTGTTTIQLTTPNSPTITINTSTSPSCVPGCDGTASTMSAGGTPGYTYAISGGASIDALGNASILCAGIIYTITVTDANGCTGTTTLQLTAPGAPTLTINTSTSPSCVPGCDGTASTISAGGTPGYTYAISGGASIDAVGNAGLLCAGIIYTITVTDANGCTGTTTIQLTAPNSPTLQITNQTNISCFGLCDGSVTVAGNGGTPPYNFAISPGAIQGPVGTFTSLCAGAYVITITDFTGCTNTINVNIIQPPILSVAIAAFTNVTVFGGSDGTITAAAAGGTPAYNYVIFPLAGLQGPAGNFTNLPAGCYTITVTDANGCTATTSQCLTQPAIGVLTAIATDETCFGACDGTITSSITGGVGPFNYVLTPGNIGNGTGFYSNVCAGVYIITVTDANNNTTSTTATVSGPPQIVWSNATSTNITCFGAANGTISVNAAGGIGLITYTITPLGPQPNINGLFGSLPPQCYTVTATDATGCMITTVLCITEPPVLSLSAAVVQNNNCFGDGSGTIAINAIGGNPIPNYTYVLTPGGQTNTNGQFVGLGAGNYTIIVTDGSGCTASTGGILITEPPAMVFSTVNLHEVYCYGQATGSIAVVAGGGTGGIVFSISPNATQFPLGFFKDLAAGTYIITATDANGCTATTAATIIQNPQLRITSLSIVEPICSYDSTGVISVTATGGVAPILYSLNNGIPQLSGTFTGLVMGNYKVTLIDNLGCSTDTTIQLTGPSPVSATIQTEDTKCIDSKDGRATIIGTGGRGGYKYYVTPGLHINKTGKFYDLASGTYTVRVVDTVGCEYMTTFTINPPSNPLGNTMTKQDLNCHGKGNEGSATANVFGGQPPYVYEWSTTPVQNTAMASTLYFGWYNVLIADANGCEYRDSVYIEEGPCCDVSFVPNAFSPNGDNNNDEFRVFSTAGIILIQLEVYDRWGQKLWSTADWRRGWDGTIDGKEAGVGTYFYVFRYTCTRDGNTYVKKGDVTLIR